jgi:hypothetical protein
MLPRLHNNTTNLNHTVPTLTIILSHDNTTTTITLPNRNRCTIILGALFGISTIHSYANDTAFIIILDHIRLSLPLLPHHTHFCFPLLLYVNDTIYLKIPTYTPNDD